MALLDGIFSGSKGVVAMLADTLAGDAVLVRLGEQGAYDPKTDTYAPSTDTETTVKFIQETMKRNVLTHVDGVLIEAGDLVGSIPCQQGRTSRTFDDLSRRHRRVSRIAILIPNLPMEENTVPSFEDLKKIHDTIRNYERSRRQYKKGTAKLYVHCKGGVDRTGVVIATYLIYTGLTVEEAKKRFLIVSKPMQGRYRHKPLIELNWIVLEEYKEWLTHNETEEYPYLRDQILGGILGLAVADAVGVPVEFQSCESLRNNPVTDMRGHGTYNQPIGTWSDDTSLTLCLLESLTKKGFGSKWELDKNFPQPDYTDIMQRFLSWAYKGKYTAHGEAFDIGIATRKAIQRFRDGADPLECGGTSEMDNGNGSLMRVLPIIFYLFVLIRNMSSWAPGARAVTVLTCFVHNISSLTHAHRRSHIACGIYGLIANHFLNYPENKQKNSLKKAIEAGLFGAKGDKQHMGLYDDRLEEYEKELKQHYKRLFQKNFAQLPESKIKSSGYVVDTLEAAMWCLLNTDNYKDCILKAVNLGEDTDTVAAVAGGLAGMYYGVESIPTEWLSQLARRDYIENLCVEFYRTLSRYHPDD